MKVRLLSILSILLLLFYSLSAQEYSYTHYDVKDGLAGSNVYCITQDRQGFLWMGTEAGVSRFDGTHFKNFNLQDGLPDIEVLQIFSDSKGRVWMGPFSKSICFYYKGKIHNQENDSLLRQMRLTGKVHSFAEDGEGNILAGTRNAVYVIRPDGKTKEYETIDGKPFFCDAVSCSIDGHFLIHANQTIYRLSGEKFHPILEDIRNGGYADPLYLSLNPWLICSPIGAMFRLSSQQTGRSMDFPMSNDKVTHVSISLIGDSLAYNNETQGSYEYNLFTGARRYFNLGAYISRAFRDDEGNMWFTSLGRGIFRLNSDEFRNLSLRSSLNTNCVVHTIRKMDNCLLVGANYNMLFRFSLPSFEDSGSYKLDDAENEEIRYFKKLKNGRLFVGTSNRIYTCHWKGPLGRHLVFSVKAAVSKNDSEVLAAGAFGVIAIDPLTLRVKDTLWKDRATVINYIDGHTYMGTLNGLYVLNKDRSVVYLGDKDPALRKRISSVEQAGDGTIWIATYGDGIVAYKNGRRVGAFTTRQGLSSDLCLALQLQNDKIWVGTDKGLNKIDLGNQDDPVTIYTANDGLGSDIINTIFIDSPMVYAGTPAGLSFFNAARVDKSAGCRLIFLSAFSSGRDRLADTAALRLSYKGNNIRFEYAGISYKSSGNIWYRHRLLGLDSTWKMTKESFLDYPTLPSGDYELQLQAINKFGVKSPPASIRFTVTTPFWKTVWFDVAVLSLFVFLTWLFVTLRIRQLRRRQAEQEKLHKRMAETEHMALQAQMNPHFIFNCLNSIQQYIFDQDILAANKYITGFARLIRATLNNSSKPFISLADEVDYLSNYLSLEKLRFKEKMSYTIDVHPSLDMDMEDIFIPPMLIQPYVENSIRHGLRHKKGGEGFIRISVMQESDKLTFVIEDNGIGREQAARYKTREHIEYQSRGMSLTADRIRLINTVNGDSIRVEVLDITDRRGNAAGTRVTVRFPRYDLYLQKDTI